MLLLVAFLLILALTLEGTFVALPIVLVLLIVMQIAYPNGWTLVAAFFAGLFLDVMLFRQLGQTSLFFLVFLTLIALYKRKFEVRTYQFFLFATTLGVGSYLLFLGSRVFFLQLSVGLFVGLIFFALFVRKHEMTERYLKK